LYRKDCSPKNEIDFHLDFSFCAVDVKLHFVTTMDFSASSFIAHFGGRCLNALDLMGDFFQGCIPVSQVINEDDVNVD